MRTAILLSGILVASALGLEFGEFTGKFLSMALIVLFGMDIVKDV